MHSIIAKMLRMETRSHLLITLIIITTANAQKRFGEDCGPDAHCSTGDSGLICNEGKCACGNGTLTDSLKYAMTWDPTRSQCVGVEDSVCIGTGRFPPPQGTKGVRCNGTLTCIQIKGMGFGQGQCKNVEQTNGHGGTCAHDRYCDTQAGLICHETNKRCACGGGPLTDIHHFVMEWDAARGSCVATPGSACVGTRMAPHPTSAKTVECWRGECLQLSSMPPGVGVCEGVGQDTTTTTTTTTEGSSSSSTDAPSTTTDGAAGMSCVGLLVIGSAVTLSVF